MKVKYQLILLGNNRFKKNTLSSFHSKVKELGLDRNMIKEIGINNFQNQYKKNAPTVCLYFGGKQKATSNELTILKILLKDSVLVVPVVHNLNSFTKEVPDNIRHINGFQLSSADHVESLVSCILEGFSLLRLSRRLFISYKRDESTPIAIQLFEKLEEKGFDVFLDTHGVKKGYDFQEELWHRMVDSDIVVMLDTPKFLTSTWTRQELMKATDMSIGIVQCIWPGNTAAEHTGLCHQIKLTVSNFKKGKFNYKYKGDPISFTDSSVATIISEVESLRARSLAARQANIIKDFIYQAALRNLTVTLQPDKTITFSRKGKQILVIPTIGVPHAFTYDESRQLIRDIKKHHITKVYLLYDNRNIRKRWLSHLDWLNDYLPVEAVKTSEIDKWIGKMKR